MAEKAVQELEKELLRNDPTGAAVSNLTLQLVTDQLNCLIRDRGLSAKEIILQREQLTGQQLNFKDKSLCKQQNESRKQNHRPSAASKSRSGVCTESSIKIGDLVYVKSELSKFKARERYIVVAIYNNFATIQKLNNEKLMSTQYKVPLSTIFKSVPTKQAYHEWDNHLNSNTSDSDSEKEPAQNVQEGSDHDSPSDNESGSEGEMPLLDPNVAMHPPNVEDVGDSTRTSQRSRRPPAWLRSDEWVKD